MFTLLNEMVPSFNPSAFDWSYEQLSGDYPTYYGSGSSSWDIGNVHFIQLNDYPQYTRDFIWDSGLASQTNYHIYKSLDWLESQLTTAQSAGQYIIVNLHDWVDASSDTTTLSTSGKTFQQLLQQYPVSAVFAGHVHYNVGKVGTLTGNDNMTVYIFEDGSVHRGSFLVSRIVGSNLYVWTMQVNHWVSPPTIEVVSGSTTTTVTSSNQSSIFSVAGGYVAETVPLRS
jgi:hypothetical protein